MKLTITPESFTQAAAWVTKALDTKDTNNFVTLYSDGAENSYLSYGAGSSFMKAPLIGAKIELEAGETEVALTLSGLEVKRLSGVLKGNKTELELSKKLSDAKAPLSIKRGTDRFQVQLSEAKPGTQPSFERLGSVANGEFFDTLNKLAKLTDTANAGAIPSIAAVDIKLNPEAETVTVMATDRYALGEIVLPYTPNSSAKFYKDNVNMLIPEHHARMVAPARGSVEEVELIHDSASGRLGYEFADGRIALFSLSTADPISYGALLENSESLDCSALLDLNALKTALGTIKSLSADESSIHLKVSKDNLEVSDMRKKNSVNVGVSEFTVAGDKKTHELSFHRKILDEILTPISTARFNLKWGSDESRWVTLEPVFDDDSVADNVFLLATLNHDSV